MLDTGIDIPEITNLVFMKPVYSKIKLWQMIGRGTRSQEACHYFDRLPNGRKTEFKIIDFWANEFDKGEEVTAAQTPAVLVTIFNTRLKLLDLYLDQQDSPDCQRVIADLRAQIAQIPTDSFTIKKIYPQVEEAWKDRFWRHLTKDKLEFLKIQVGPLLRFASEVDVPAATFTNKVERLKLDILMNRVQPATLQSIVEDVDRLPDFVHEDPARKDVIEMALSPSRLGKASHEELSRLITALSGQMKYRRERPNTLLELDLDDSIESRGEVARRAVTAQAYEEGYRERVEQRILELVENHPTIAAIKRGRKVTDRQLLELEHILREDLSEAGAQSFEVIQKTFGVKVGGFLAVLRQLLNLDAAALPDYETIVQRIFEQYINEHTYTADQIRFLRAVQSVFVQQRKLERANLYEGALLSFGMNAVERLFTEKEIRELLNFTEQLAA
jgi:type I restriction enzyme R subunit